MDDKKPIISYKFKIKSAQPIADNDTLTFNEALIEIKLEYMEEFDKGFIEAQKVIARYTK